MKTWAILTVEGKTITEINVLVKQVTKSCSRLWLSLYINRYDQTNDCRYKLTSFLNSPWARLTLRISCFKYLMITFQRVSLWYVLPTFIIKFSWVEFLHTTYLLKFRRSFEISRKKTIFNADYFKCIEINFLIADSINCFAPCFAWHISTARCYDKLIIEELSEHCHCFVSFLQFY